MYLAQSTSMASHDQKRGKAKPKQSKRHHVNWHEAAVCAIQIELRNYAHMLEFLPEYVLGRNSNRIDLLIVKKLSEQAIPKNIARIFRSYNLFEIKGIGSSTGTDAYYKTIGYAGLFIDQIGGKNQYTALDVSLTFLSMHYPRSLINHLTKERDLVVAKSSPGIYTVSKEIFSVQIIVTGKLPPEENLYLHCLKKDLPDTKTLNRIAADYKEHRGQPLYNSYLHQLATAHLAKKGETMIICEGLLNLFGTSSEEIIENTRQEDADYYQPQIDRLASRVQYLTDLLKQNHIPFDSSPDQ